VVSIDKVPGIDWKWLTWWATGGLQAEPCCLSCCSAAGMFRCWRLWLLLPVTVDQAWWQWAWCIQNDAGNDDITCSTIVSWRTILLMSGSDNYSSETFQYWWWCVTAETDACVLLTAVPLLIIVFGCFGKVRDDRDGNDGDDQTIVHWWWWWRRGIMNWRGYRCWLEGEQLLWWNSANRLEPEE